MFGVKNYYIDMSYKNTSLLTVDMRLHSALTFYQKVYQEWIDNPPLCLKTNWDTVLEIFIRHLNGEESKRYTSFKSNWLGIIPMVEAEYLTKHDLLFTPTDKLINFLQIRSCAL